MFRSSAADKGSKAKVKKVSSKPSKEKVVLGNQPHISEKGQGEKWVPWLFVCRTLRECIVTSPHPTSPPLTPTTLPPYFCSIVIHLPAFSLTKIILWLINKQIEVIALEQLTSHIEQAHNNRKPESLPSGM